MVRRHRAHWSTYPVYRWYRKTIDDLDQRQDLPMADMMAGEAVLVTGELLCRLGHGVNANGITYGCLAKGEKNIILRDHILANHGLITVDPTGWRWKKIIAYYEDLQQRWNVNRQIRLQTDTNFIPDPSELEPPKPKNNYPEGLSHTLSGSELGQKEYMEYMQSLYASESSHLPQSSVPAEASSSKGSGKQNLDYMDSLFSPQASPPTGSGRQNLDYMDSLSSPPASHPSPPQDEMDIDDDADGDEDIDFEEFVDDEQYNEEDYQ